MDIQVDVDLEVGRENEEQPCNKIGFGDQDQKEVDSEDGEF